MRRIYLNNCHPLQHNIKQIIEKFCLTDRLSIENANAAAYDWIYTELMEFEGKLPPVSDESDLDLQEGDVVRNISVNIRFQDGWDE